MLGLEIPHFGLKRQHKQLKEELLDATDQVLRSGQFLSGTFTRQFERYLQHKTNTLGAVTVHSGTQALEIIARYCFINSNFPPDDKITLPNISYPATLNAFLNTNYKVKLNDTDKFGISNFDHNSKDVHCLVGLYGRKPWHGKEYKWLIVDGAQHWLVAGEDIGIGMAISFDPTKNLPSTGNGGAIVTNNLQLYSYAMNYKDNGKPLFNNTGTNSKMSELDCAHILVRTKYLDQWQHRREQIRQYYCNELREYVTCLSDDNTPHSNHKFVIYVPEYRNKLHTHLLTSGIESKIHYDKTLSELMTSYLIDEKPNMFSTSYMLVRGVLSLPIYPELTDLEIEYITKEVKNFIINK